MPKAYINGNFHSLHLCLIQIGIEYLGDGDWKLPDGAFVTGGHNDDWVITLKDGEVIHVYTEE